MPRLYAIPVPNMRRVVLIDLTGIDFDPLRGTPDAYDKARKVLAAGLMGLAAGTHLHLIVPPLSAGCIEWSGCEFVVGETRKAASVTVESTDAEEALKWEVALVKAYVGDSLTKHASARQ